MDETCGGCRFFKVTRERDDGRLGECRLGKVMGVFRESMRACPSFTRVGQDAPETPAAGTRVAGRRTVVGAGGAAPRRVSSASVAGTLGGLPPEQLREAVVGALACASLFTVPDLGRAWTAGELWLVPQDEELKAKQLPLDAFFHKLAMIRDNLRVMEQKINSHEQLQDAEKLDLQRRVTLAYIAVARMGSGFTVRPEGGVSAEAHALLLAMLADAERAACSAEPPAIGERWQGGEARYIRDGETILEPVEVFFHRLVMVRDRLYTLEAQLGAHAHVGPDEADAMGAYVRRCYGSLTSFNLLFRDREDYFTSAR